MRVRAIKDVRYDEFFHTSSESTGAGYNRPEFIYYKGEWYDAKYGDTIDKIHVYYNFRELTEEEKLVPVWERPFVRNTGYLQFHISIVRKYFVDVIENRESLIDEILK